MLTPLLLALTLAPAPDADARAPSAVPAPGIAPGRVAPPPSHVRLVGGHRVVEQADGNWTSVDRKHGFVARIGVDGRLEFSALPTGGRPQHPWYAQARDPFTGQPAGRRNDPNFSNPSVTNQGSAGNALGALLTAGVFKGIEVGSERRHGKRVTNQPLDARDRFALDTADFRAHLATQWYEARLQSALEQLDADLRALWSDGVKPKTRRLAVFELWRRFPEQLPAVPLHPPPALRRELEARRVLIGDVGRDLVAEFVRTYMPRGTIEGYSRGELRRLNADRPLEPFDPYAQPQPSTSAK